MGTRYDKTLADYLVIAISPALIMTLVGSLVFFLLEVFYQGNFSGRLDYIFALFIFAAVLIGRIAIEEGNERAAAFALPLAAVTLLATARFVAFQGILARASLVINCGLIALIWWCAHKLTWDCTMIDETEPGAGEGLLDAAGLGQRDATPTRSVSEEPSRWNNFRASRGQPHAPGVWVVYFSLAALPLFGLGQLAIPVAQEGRRRYAFFLLAIYVASGLGLLLTTSFLGLRRYLRQRRLPMPAIMAGAWITVGCGLIVGVMGLALFLPRPSAEFAISQVPFVVGSPDQKASNYGTGNEAGQGPGRAASGEQDQPSQDRAEDHAQGNNSAADGGKSPSDKASGKGNSDKPGEGNDNHKPSSDEPPGDKSDKQGAADDKPRPQSDGDAKANPDRDGSKTDSPPSQSSGGQPRDNRSQGSRNSEGKGKSGSGTPSEQRPATPSPEPPQPNMTPPSLDVASWFGWLLPLFQLAFYAAVVVGAAYAAWRHRETIAAALRNLIAELRAFWERLFGGRKKSAKEAAEAESKSLRRRQFADFADPFATGLADGVSADQLVRYLFEALEAWARDNGCPRDLEQTPLEFARSVARRTEPLRPSVLLLADLYCEAAYAPGRLKISNRQPLEEFWRVLQSLAAAAHRDEANGTVVATG